MIMQVTPELEQDFIAACSFDPIIGARLYTLLRCYGCSMPGLRLWLAQENGVPTAAISRFDGWLVFSASGRVDVEELGGFVRAIGEYRYIEGAPEVCARLGIEGEFESSHTMRYAAASGFDEDFGAVCENPRLSDVYHILCTENPWFANTTSWDGWYPHTSHLLRHGLGFAAVLCADGVPVSTGGVYTMGEQVAVIGGLATLHAYRGRGYASVLTKYLINKILAQDKIPALFCASDSLARYYEGFGFVQSGKWGEITLDN